MTRETFGSRLAGFGGFGPGFDFLRLFLASGVVLWHTFPITTGTPRLIEDTPAWFAVSLMVPMFFALSGYLVTASANRISVGPYLMNRVARIFPALVVVVFFCALVLGPLVTTVPLGEYFRDGAFWRYLLNIFGLVSYFLPGVFKDLPFAGGVNGSLWTVPYEILCYIIMAGLMVTGLVRHWWVLVLLFAAITLFAFAAMLPPGTLPPALEVLAYSPRLAAAAKIIPFFLLGATGYLLRDHIPHRAWLAVLAIAIILAVGFLGNPAWQRSPMLWLLTGIPVSYLVVWAGLTRLPKPNILGGGDFSYGVYLWHFPILQTLMLVFGFTSWWALGLTGALPILVVAALSWHFVEKPVLRWRKRWSTVGAHIAAEDQTARPQGGTVAGKVDA